MNMTQRLNRIFTRAHDILSPRDFTGEKFVTEINGGVHPLEIVEITDGEAGAAATAVLRNSTSGRIGEPQGFPGHSVFNEADWDRKMSQRIFAAEAEIIIRDEMLARRAVEIRSQREQETAIAALERIALGTSANSIENAVARDVILAIEVVFEDIRTNDENSAGFVANQISRVHEWGDKILLSLPQQEWLQDVAKRAVKRHRAPK